VLGVDAVERVALRAELADHLDLVLARGQRSFHLVAPQRTQHCAHPFAAATAAKRQWPGFEQARRFLVIQAKQQLLGRACQQFAHAQRGGELQHAVPGILVPFGGMAALVGHFLQHQAHRMPGIRRQQDARGQLFGLAEIVFQRRGQARIAQLDQALVTLSAFQVAHRDGHHCVGKSVQRQRLRQRFVPARQTPQPARVVAFGEQQAQRGRALQLDRQRSIELDVAGEQRAGRERFAKQRAQRRRVFGASGNLAPRRAQAHQHAAHAGARQQEAVHHIIIGRRGHGRFSRGGHKAGRWGRDGAGTTPRILVGFPLPVSPCPHRHADPAGQSCCAGWASWPWPGWDRPGWPC
jgi:hypothetical protein